MSIHTLEDQAYEQAQELKDFGHAKLYEVANKAKILVLEASDEYIPIQDFKEIFEEVGQTARNLRKSTLVFDKRKLKVFHQPSMEWYFTVWKEEMYAKGLTKHHKILPNDPLFRNSVQIGRNKINKDYPDAKFHKMEILYFDNLSEALDG